MPYEATLRAVRDGLGSTFAELDAWFDRDEALLHFQPASGGWSIVQVLEHITLTNRFLMMTLGKHLALAEKRSRRGAIPSEGESDLKRLEIIGERGSFVWIRPEHMEPTGKVAMGEVRLTLHRQLDECLSDLMRMAAGIGALGQVTMSVGGLGKIDLYQWLYFLVQHARRHLQQMAANEAEYLSARKAT